MWEKLKTAFGLKTKLDAETKRADEAEKKLVSCTSDLGKLKK